MARQPNFFLVGAPKCGTTALYEYLRRHPSIFMPAFKEPHYFAGDLGAYRLIRTADAYATLFAPASGQHVRVGEASVYYVRSSQAIPQIRAFDPDARIIAMFRNPVDMLHALHSQLLYVGEESVPDFERAWRLQTRYITRCFEAKAGASRWHRRAPGVAPRSRGLSGGLAWVEGRVALGRSSTA